jgi:hypothetical protein
MILPVKKRKGANWPENSYLFAGGGKLLRKTGCASWTACEAWTREIDYSLRIAMWGVY